MCTDHRHIEGPAAPTKSFFPGKDLWNKSNKHGNGTSSARSLTGCGLVNNRKDFSKWILITGNFYKCSSFFSVCYIQHQYHTFHHYFFLMPLIDGGRGGMWRNIQWIDFQFSPRNFRLVPQPARNLGSKTPGESECEAIFSLIFVAGQCEH